MPQLDFFTIQIQILCLLISVFTIYFLLLKYAMPSHDVLLRLQIKKLYQYKTQIFFFNFLIEKFKEKNFYYVNLYSLVLNDFTKIYFNFINSTLGLLYFIKIEKNKLNLHEIKPLIIALEHNVRLIEKNAYKVNRILYSNQDLKNLTGF